ncbi:MAG: alpha-galactosidase [Pseudomonadota bacterium]
MTTRPTDLWTLRGQHTQLIVDTRGGQPVLRYWGPTLVTDLTESLHTLWRRPAAPASADSQAALALTPQRGFGFAGAVALDVNRGGQGWGTAAQVCAVTEHEDALAFTSSCATTGIELTHRLTMDPVTDVVTVTVTLTNQGDAAVSVHRLPSLCVPVDADWSVTSWHGRWAFESQLQTVEPFTGAWVRENRAGRTSHHTAPTVWCHEATDSLAKGATLGLHLAWSGNFRDTVESLPDGRRYAALECVWLPGELSLKPGESVTAPAVIGSFSARGMDGVATAFHRYVRRHVLRPAFHAKPRPVHFNTWEAVYFDVNAKVLPSLIDAAARIGIERFVLDDGWFVGRNDDTAALGDWTVDRHKFPDGLGPIAERVIEAGMEFGLWIEPEMVNPNSELYRAHPDWVQSLPGVDVVMARNQLLLDLSRREVCDYLFGCIDALLSEVPIGYLKWDMNRDLAQPGGAGGTPIAYRHTRELYALLDALRDRHPAVEIESCASGGGRADLGILARTDRIWTSDSNDALDRLSIQRGFATVFPPEVMGAHVGPRDCHITGRRFDMAFRAAVAMFGHMGVEADVRELDDDERATLMAAIALYKANRSWMHNGDTVSLQTPAHEHAHGIVAASGERALFLHAIVASAAVAWSPRLRLRGLDAQANYRIDTVWPMSIEADTIGGEAFTGDALMRIGLPMRVAKPQTAVIYSLERC